MLWSVLHRLVVARSQLAVRRLLGNCSEGLLEKCRRLPRLKIDRISEELWQNVAWDSLNLNGLVLDLVRLFVNIQLELQQPGSSRGALLLRIRAYLGNQPLIRGAARAQFDTQSILSVNQWVLQARTIYLGHFLRGSCGCEGRLL